MSMMRQSLLRALILLLEKVLIEQRVYTVTIGAPRARTTNTKPTETDMADNNKTLQHQQEILVSLTGHTGGETGDAIAFDSPPVWTSSDTTILDVRPSADGTKALLGSFDMDGTATVTIEAKDETGLGLTIITVVVAAPDVDVDFVEVTFGDAKPRTTDIPS